MAEEGATEVTACSEAIAQLIRLVVSLRMYRAGARLAMNAVTTLTQSDMRSRAEEMSVVVKNIISAYTNLITRLYDVLPDIVLTCVSEGMDVKEMLSVIQSYI